MEKTPSEEEQSVKRQYRFETWISVDLLLVVRVGAGW